jgi:hypothetical protein
LLARFVRFRGMGQGAAHPPLRSADFNTSFALKGPHQFTPLARAAKAASDEASREFAASN